jgi:hypothetical protein
MLKKKFQNFSKRRQEIRGKPDYILRASATCRAIFCWRSNKQGYSLKKVKVNRMIKTEKTVIIIEEWNMAGKGMTGQPPRRGMEYGGKRNDRATAAEMK